MRSEWALLSRSPISRASARLAVAREKVAGSSTHDAKNAASVNALVRTATDSPSGSDIAIESHLRPSDTYARVRQNHPSAVARRTPISTYSLDRRLHVN